MASLTPADTVQSALRGALAFPITPYSSDGSVDLQAVAVNASILTRDSISAIVAPSGTGEFFGLSVGEATAIVETTVAAAKGKPVIAAAGFGPVVGAQLAREAEAVGASAIMIVPPYYGTPDPQSLIRYYAEIAAATSLPVIPYARDAALFSPQLAAQLVSDVPQVVAFKDGRANVRLFQQIREHVISVHGSERLVWLGGSGDDLVGPYFAAGAEGFTSSLACFWPEAAGTLFQLASSGNYRELADYHQRVVAPIYALRQRKPGYEVSVMKAAMEILGYAAGPARSPLANVTDDERAELAALLSDLAVPTAADRGLR